MRKLHWIILSTVLLFVLAACDPDGTGGPVVQKEEIKDYLTEEAFMASTDLERANRNIDFWKEKLASDPGSVTYMMKLASAYSNRYEISAQIGDLQRADSLLGKVAGLPRAKTAETLQAMARLSMTKHHFRDAFRYGKEALEIGDNKETSHMLLFDAMMERGDYQLAQKKLERMRNGYDFSYLIRMSRYQDHRGRLDSAIHYMEEARKLVDHSPGLTAWTTSNLADMYGHANKVAKSYRNYMKVLEMEQAGGSFLHSLKGIAWIAYSHDHNPKLAREILQFVQKHSSSPGVILKRAELAEYAGDSAQRARLLREFVAQAGNGEYFGMYDAHLIEVLSSDFERGPQALRLAEKELVNRPSPQIYDLKAWAHLQKGEIREALEIVRNHVEGQTHEPVPAYHMARIYQAAGKPEKALEHYRAALEAGYELGPVIEKEIREGMQRARANVAETPEDGMFGSIVGRLSLPGE